MQIMGDPEKRAQFFAERKAAEAARVAAMTPEERARYDEERKQEEEYERFLGERSTLTNGEVMRERDQLEQTLDAVGAERDEALVDAEKTHKSLDHALGAWANTHAKLKGATGSQGGTDRKLTEARQRIAELEAELVKIKAERDAALKARDEMLKLYTDQHGK